MAKAEFYEIIIRDRKNDTLVEKDIIEIIKERLKSKDDDLLCSGKTCLAILSDFVENIDSATFDFSKLTNEVINSTIISKPLDSIDTFEEFNKMESDKVIPTVEEISFISKISSEYENDELVKKLIESDVEYFTIYKIFRDNNGLISDSELDLFCKKTIQRMKKEKIFFKIKKLSNKKKGYLLIFQKAMHGFDVEHLYEYLNRHLLINDNIKVHFKKIYDISFMDALQNSEIKNFKFSYNAESKNNLLDNDFASPLYFLTKMLGDSITISVNNEDDLLDNKKLLGFFEMANDAGLLKTCKIKKAGTQKEINSTDSGLELSHTNKRKIVDINHANSFFLEAFENKENIIYNRM
ncbi:MAG: hypothetical protein COA66_02595 [Arcobacter sp.]|nr:MAG: hypothetical protein COA66_02595 [Arcobacter sp.]